MDHKRLSHKWNRTKMETRGDVLLLPTRIPLSLRLDFTTPIFAFHLVVCVLTTSTPSPVRNNLNCRFDCTHHLPSASATLSISLLLCSLSRPLPCELDMDGKRVRSVACGSTHTACIVTRAWVSDDLIKNCMACKTRFSLVNRKVL